MSHPRSEARPADRFADFARAGSLRVYNTRTRGTEAFAPLEAGHVRIYVCGLTPSAQAHLGHARSFMFFDIVRRWLTFKGYRVTYVQNVTDIDDRSINAARAEGTTYRAIVDRYYDSFRASMAALDVREPDHEPRATDYIAEILAMIEDLVARDFAYVVEDGVYFRVRAFPRYGALSGRNLDELMVGARIAAGEKKDDPLDFALWKFARPDEPSWASPWGAGRPGWHIECSAMSRALLGEPFDMHGGGFDLIFPHHENEIAQSEALMPQAPMANVWMHGGLLAFDGKKMSKSLGNFEPLEDLLRRHDPQAIRLLFLQTGYRKPMNFSEASIEGASIGLQRLFEAYDVLREAAPAPAAASDEAEARLDGFVSRFCAALDDDFNTSGAIATLFEIASEAASFVRDGNASRASAFLHEALGIVGIVAAHRRARAAVRPALREQLSVGASDGVAPFVVTGPDDVAGFGDEALSGLLNALEGFASDAPGPVADHLRAALDAGANHRASAVNNAIVARYFAKRAKDYALADHLRDALKTGGIAVTDTKEGASWNVVA